MEATTGWLLPLQGHLRPFDMIPAIFEYFLIKSVPDSTCIFHSPTLGTSHSPRISSSFQWRRVVRNQDPGTGYAHVIGTLLFLGLRSNKAKDQMYVQTFFLLWSFALWLHRYYVFYKLKVCGSPTLSKSLSIGRCHFSNSICSLCISMSTFGKVCIHNTHCFHRHNAIAYLINYSVV